MYSYTPADTNVYFMTMSEIHNRLLRIDSETMKYELVFDNSVINDSEALHHALCFIEPGDDYSVKYSMLANKEECEHCTGTLITGVCQECITPASTINKCNCEHSECSHKSSSCENPSDEINKIIFIGATCRACYLNYPPAFRV